MDIQDDDMSLNIDVAMIADADYEHLRDQLELVQPDVLAEEGRYLQLCPQPRDLPAEGATGKT